MTVGALSIVFWEPGGRQAERYEASGRSLEIPVDGLSGNGRCPVENPFGPRASRNPLPSAEIRELLYNTI